MRILGTACACLLGVGPALCGPLGLTAVPDPMIFSAPFSGSPVTPQLAVIFFNDTPASVTGIQSIETTTGQDWLLAAVLSGDVSVTADTSVVSTGSYMGNVTANTVFGPLAFQVDLTVGSASAAPEPSSLLLILT